MSDWEGFEEKGWEEKVRRGRGEEGRRWMEEK